MGNGTWRSERESDGMDAASGAISERGANMKCRDCKWMYTNETMDDLYICVNGNSKKFGEYTGICCEDECEDGWEL